MDFKDIIKNIKPEILTKGLSKITTLPISTDKILDLMSKVPVVRIIAYAEKGFNSMTEEQKVEFVKNCMIAAAKAAA